MVLHRPIELASSAQEKLWDFKLLRVNFKKVLRRPVELAAVTRQVPLAAKKAGRPRLPGASRPYINSNRRSNQALAADAA